jgi:hypothetical protein
MTGIRSGEQLIPVKRIARRVGVQAVAVAGMACVAKPPKILSNSPELAPQRPLDTL